MTEAALSRRVVVVAASAWGARSREEDEEEEDEKAKEVDNVVARRREKVSLYRAPRAADDTSNIIRERGEERGTSWPSVFSATSRARP